MKAAPNAATAIGQRYGYSPSDSLGAAKTVASIASLI